MTMPYSGGPFRNVRPVEEQQAVLSPGQPPGAAEMIAQALAFQPSSSVGPPPTFGEQVQSPNSGVMGVIGTILKSLNPNTLAQGAGIAGPINDALVGMEGMAASAGRGTMSALAGDDLTNLVLGQAGGQPGTPQQTPMSRPDAPPQPQQAEVPGAFAGNTGPWQLPDMNLPDLQQAVPTNFDPARAALGSVPEQQEIGTAEQLSRLFGGQAGGGLQALQNAPPGRAASLGEVIAGIGAGGSQSQAVTNAEQRQLVARHEEQMERRQIQESQIALREEMSIADTSNTNAQQFNERKMFEAQASRQQALVNHQATLPQAIPGVGYYDPIKQKVINTSNTRSRILEGFKLAADLQEDFSEKVSQLGGYTATRTGLSPAEQFSFDVGAMAVNSTRKNEFINIVVERLKEEGDPDYAETVGEFASGTEITFTNKDVGNAVATDVMTMITAAVMEDLEHKRNGTVSPYGNAFDEFIRANASDDSFRYSDQLNSLMGAGQ